MDNTFTLETTYGIAYRTEKPVPIPEIVDSLKGLERIIKRTAPFMEAAYPGLKIYDVQVYIDELYSGSLVKNFVVRYLCGGEQNAKEIQELFDKLSKESPMVKQVVAVGVGALIMYGAMNATGCAPSAKIEAHHSVIIEAGGDVNIGADTIREILDGVSDRKRLARDAVDVVHPAKNENALIEFSGFEALNISGDVVQEVPNEYEPPIPEERSQRYRDVKILISASDRDNTEKGWAGVVPQVVDKRVKFSLDITVDPSNLHGKTQVKADVTVHEKFINSKRKYEPYLVEVNAIH